MKRLLFALAASFSLHAVALGALAWLTLDHALIGLPRTAASGSIALVIDAEAAGDQDDGALVPRFAAPAAESVVLEAMVLRQTPLPPLAAAAAEEMLPPEPASPPAMLSERASPEPKPAPPMPSGAAMPPARRQSEPSPFSLPPPVPAHLVRTDEAGPRLGANNPPPAYPAEAAAAWQQGVVVLRVRVSRDGRVLDLRIEQSSGHPSLDRAAIAAVRGWQFEPARREGAPVVGEALVPVRFSLRF